MYQNIWSEKRGNNQVEVHLWDDVAGYQNFIFKNYAYVKDGGGQYRSIYGDKLKKVSYWTEDDFKTGRVFESDIPLDTRILIDRYPDSDEPSKNHRELYFDIEVEVTDGFPMPEEAKNKITSVALYNNIDKEYKVYVLGKIPSKKNVKVFDSEYELLQALMKYWMDFKPTIVTGWNSDGFDIPYLYNRLAQIMGLDIANALSLIHI